MGNKASKTISNEEIKNKVFVVGHNTYYQLGLGHNKRVRQLVSFTRYNEGISVKDINSGDNNVFITTNDNRYLFAGNNSSGESGIENKGQTIKKCTENIYFSEKNIKIKKIHFKWNHAIWQSIGNELYASGNNYSNQCGISGLIKDRLFIPFPTLIENTPSCITDIAMGDNHTLILADNASIDNIDCIISAWRRLASTTKIIPNDVIIIIYNYYCIKGIVYSTGYKSKQSIYDNSGADYNGFDEIPFFKGKTIKHIAAGCNTSIFVDINDVIWSKRNSVIVPTINEYFQMNKVKIKQVSTAGSHYLVLGYNGIRYSWGSNFYGQCGIGRGQTIISTPERVDVDSKYKIVKIKAGRYHSYIMSDDEQHFLFGHNSYNECSLKPVGGNKNESTKHIKSPLCINDIFNELTNNTKNIRDIWIGPSVTWIITDHKQ